MNPRSVPQSAKQKRRKKHRNRRRFILLSAFLLLVLLVACLIMLIVHSLDSSSPAASNQSSQKTAPPTTTTTTIRTIAAENLDARLGSFGIVLYDETQDAIVYSRYADVQFAPASLTKLLTAALVCKYTDENTEFTVGDERSLVAKDASIAQLQVGMRLSRQMILDAILLPSGNDAAYTAAVHIGRQESGNPSLDAISAAAAFADLMNAQLKELGCTGSHFVTPDGYTAPEHYTTPADMLRIAQYARSFADIRETVMQRTVTHVPLSGQRKTWNNSNLMLYEKTEGKDNAYYNPYVTGMKTGYTSEAGHCVVISANRDGRELIAVVMNAPTSDIRWADAAALVEAGFNNMP